MEFTCPISRWPPLDLPIAGLGDWIARLVKPIATALKLKCVDKHGNVKPDSGCRKRQSMLNRAFPRA